jgi:hypothetical protein
VNLLAARVPLRVRGVPEILDLGFVFVSGNRRIFLSLMALVLVPFFGIAVALRHALGWQWWFVWPLAIVMGGFSQGVFTAAAGELLFSERALARSTFMSFLRRFFPYVGSLLVSRALSSVVVLLPFLLRSLGYAAFVREAVLLEKASVRTAMSRSNGLVKRQEGASFGLFLSLLAAQAAFVVSAELLGQGVVEFALQFGRPFGSLSDGGSLYALAGFFASVPYVAVVRFLKYIDIRTRKEGWDIQIKFTALLADAEPAGEPQVA